MKRFDKQHLNYNGIGSHKTQIQFDHGEILKDRQISVNRMEITWKKTKLIGMEGKAYRGYSRGDGKVINNISRQIRKLGTVCNSKDCIRTKNKPCSEISEQKRLRITY